MIADDRTRSQERVAGQAVRSVIAAGISLLCKVVAIALPHEAPMALSWALAVGQVGAALYSVAAGYFVLGTPRQARRPRDTWLAKLGVFVSGAYLLLLMVGSALFWVIGREKVKQHATAVCLSNLQQLTNAMSLYLADSNGVFPPAAGWCDAVRPYSDVTYGPDVFSCPREPSLACGYAFDSLLGGMANGLIKNPRDTVLLFESDLGWNGAGGLESLPRRIRHFNGDCYSFADGHIAWVSRSKASTLEWGVAATSKAQQGP